MPHLIIEFSANLEDDIDLDGLMVKLRDCAVASGVFPLGGIRVRGARRERYLVTDGDPDNGFVHVTARIGHGRPVAVRKQVAASLFEVLTDHLEPLYKRRGLAISFEMQEIDPATSFKKNNLHERLTERA
jgi:5-carboxymethyl-2-hydroxymuconate isomerase